MILCNICQDFDIRELLLRSAAQKPNATGNTDRNYVDTNDFRAAMPEFFKHHEGIVALKKSMEQNCQLCTLFWQTWVKTLDKDDFDDEWLERYFQGQLHIGSSSWTTSRQGFPYITLTQQTPAGNSRTLCSFEAFADREDIPTDGVELLGRAVYSDPSSRGCISVAGEWLKACLHEHKECPTDQARPLPTRVIHVGDENGTPKLIDTNETTDAYIALSYCWGGDSTFIFCERTKDNLRAGIPLNDFPATLRDAVLITRSLGVKYVWIDALCIKQDSAEDWAREAAKMRDVYSNSVLTVVAANAPSTQSGIFAERNSENGRATLEWRDPAGKRFSKVHLRPGNELWDHALSSSMLMTRGWTLQEGLLAPRILSYGAQQMIWECPCYQADEGRRVTKATEDYRAKGFIQNCIRIQNTEVTKPKESLFEKLSLRSHKPEKWWKAYAVADPYDKWNDICEQFMRRSLTKDFDVLPALSGLARVFHHVLKDEYYAGLWKKDLLSTLMWIRSPRYPADRKSRFDLTKPSEYLAPSWSWASILGRESSMGNAWKAREALKVSAHSTAKIISVSTTLKGEDPFGQVTGGELVLHTRFFKIDQLPPVYSLEKEFFDDMPDSVKSTAFQEVVYTNLCVTNSMVYEYFQKHEPCANQEYGAVELVRWDKSPGSQVPGIDVLLVESTGRDEKYRRIGQLGLRKYPVPEKEAVGEDAYWGTILDNNAYDELVRAKSKKRIITLV